MIVYFYLLVLFYSISKYIEHYKKVGFKFPLLQISFFIIGWFLTNQLDKSFEFCLFFNALISAFLLLFLDFVSRLFGMQKKGLKNIPQNFINYVGLIDGLNITLISITLFFSYYLEYSFFINMDFLLKNTETLKVYIDNYKFALSIIKDALFFLGALIGVIMTILFSSTNWKIKKKGDRKRHYINNHSAFRIILGYLLIAISSFIWLVKPLTEKIFKLTELVK